MAGDFAHFDHLSQRPNGNDNINEKQTESQQQQQHLARIIAFGLPQSSTEASKAQAISGEGRQDVGFKLGDGARENEAAAQTDDKNGISPNDSYGDDGGGNRNGASNRSNNKAEIRGGRAGGNNDVGGNNGSKLGPKSRSRRAADSPSFKTIVAERREFLPHEPIELTCPLALTDELDLDLVRIEWWLLVAAGPRGADSNSTLTPATWVRMMRPNLMWRSPSSNQSKLAAESLEGRDLVVIDYVTRANGSGSTGQDGDYFGDGQEEGKARDGETSTVITRIEHLIIDSASSPLIRAKTDGRTSDAAPNSRLERLLLCRITNSIGQLDVIFPVVIDGSSPRARQEARQRLALRRRPSAPLPKANSPSPKYQLSGDHQESAIKRAKLALRRELDEQIERRLKSALEAHQLFIPIYLPEDLLRPDESEQRLAPFPPSQARSMNLAQNNRPATRQTNSSTLNSGNATGQVSVARISQASGSYDELDRARGGNSTARNKVTMRSIALNLIGRYTSNRMSMVDPKAGANQLDYEDYIESSEGENLTRPEEKSKTRLALDRLHATAHHLHAKYLSGWLQIIARDATLLVGIGAGLLVGCLITVLIVFRLKCSGRRRVADLQKQQAPESRTKEKSTRRAKGRPRGRKPKFEADEQEDMGYENGDDGDDDDYDVGDDAADYQPRDGRPLATVSGNLASGGQLNPARGNSSSSATNDSQRRLICSTPEESHELRSGGYGDRACTTTSRAKRVQISRDYEQQQQSSYAPVDCLCQSDEVNDGDVSGVSNLEDSIQSQTNMQHAGNSLVLNLQGDAGLTRYIVVAQPQEDSPPAYYHGGNNLISAAGSFQNEPTNNNITTSEADSSSMLVSSCHPHQPQEQQVVSADGHYHLVINPPKLGSINEGSLCLLPYTSTSSDIESQPHQFGGQLRQSHTFNGAYFTNEDLSMVQTYGTTSRRTPRCPDATANYLTNQRQPTFNCSSSITSPGASTSSSGGGYTGQHQQYIQLPTVQQQKPLMRTNQVGASLGRRSSARTDDFNCTNNSVCLDDALRLLQSSVDNCKTSD